MLSLKVTVAVQQRWQYSKGVVRVISHINSTLSDLVSILPVLELCALKWKDHLPAATAGLGSTA